MGGTPDDVCVGETAQYLASALRVQRRILEVGCGTGEVAGKLAATGFEVVALDRDDFFDYRGPNVDAVAFTGALHGLRRYRPRSIARSSSRRSS